MGAAASSTADDSLAEQACVPMELRGSPNAVHVAMRQECFTHAAQRRVVRPGAPPTRTLNLTIGTCAESTASRPSTMPTCVSLGGSACLFFSCRDLKAALKRSRRSDGVTRD